MRAFYLKALFFLFTGILSLATYSQRDYSLAYSEEMKGRAVMIGNTSLHIRSFSWIKGYYIDTLKMNDSRKTGNSSYGNDHSDMVYIDVDSDVSTFNSSSARLALPQGKNNIKWARLYWGGRNTDLTEQQLKNFRVKIKTDDTDYLSLQAKQLDRVGEQYQAWADVSEFLSQHGSAEYTVANIPLSTGAVGENGNFGGWALVIVYENDREAFNSIRIYDGYREVYRGGESMKYTVTLTGLDIPSGVLQPADARLGILVWEGDANLKGDYLTVNGKTYGDGVNRSDNLWNGTISRNGQHLSNKKPDYKNNMGIDIDEFNIGMGYNIAPQDDKMVLQFGTDSDKYFPGVILFTVKRKNPLVTLKKTVTDENNNFVADEGELLTYTFRGTNVGEGNARQVEIVDTLPSTVSFEPGSLEIVHSPGDFSTCQSDEPGDDRAEIVLLGSTWVVRFRLGKGADAHQGGVLEPGDSYEVRFRAKVNRPEHGNRLTSIMNIAHVFCRSDAQQKFSSTGFAVLNPQAGPLPVSLKSFEATRLKQEVKLRWTTAMEYNNSHFEVEKSFDARSFESIARIAGRGTTAQETHYDFSETVTEDVVYYRIKQVDYDGRFSFSRTLAVKTEAPDVEVCVFPNPFVASVTLRTQWPKTEQGEVVLLTSDGKTAYRERVSLEKGRNILELKPSSSVAAGKYLLVLQSPNRRTVTQITRN